MGYSPCHGPPQQCDVMTLNTHPYRSRTRLCTPASAPSLLQPQAGGTFDPDTSRRVLLSQGGTRLASTLWATSRRRDPSHELSQHRPWVPPQADVSRVDRWRSPLHHHTDRSNPPGDSCCQRLGDPVPRRTHRPCTPAHSGNHSQPRPAPPASARPAPCTPPAPSACTLDLEPLPHGQHMP